MTSTEPMTYKPGPELDRQIHELFGHSTLGYEFRGNRLLKKKNGINTWMDLPGYSTTWEGMRLVVEEMQRRGWGYGIESEGGGKYHARFCNPMEGAYAEKNGADTAPHAVCLAALSALQHVSHTDGLGDRDDPDNS
ncbi:hypothetical protein ACFSR7_35970 [Cohnella sp. GCM10020058]|uniref:BC1872 family protein n=1 Tax=Cohnella sp. GCM10020058 TaxID=3317330 RepID=UPI0036375F68